jgi:hypothetical protein
VRVRKRAKVCGGEGEAKKKSTDKKRFFLSTPADKPDWGCTIVALESLWQVLPSELFEKKKKGGVVDATGAQRVASFEVLTHVRTYVI